MCSIQSILLGTRDMTLPSPQEVHHLATKTRETQNYHKSALFIVNLHTSGTNGECTAMLLPPALVTFFSPGLRGLPICNKTMAFESVLPFPDHLIFLHLKFSNYQTVPVTIHILTPFRREASQPLHYVFSSLT